MMTIDGYFSSAIGITNRSRNRSDVFPRQFHLDLINPNKPEKPTPLKIQTAEKIVRNERWATFNSKMLLHLEFESGGPKKLPFGNHYGVLIALMLAIADRDQGLMRRSDCVRGPR
jgi:hypothetical protein